MQDERKDKNEKRERKPSYIAPLVKTVAKGTALVGILFLINLRFILHKKTNNLFILYTHMYHNNNNDCFFMISRNSSAGNTNGRSGQIQWKSIGVGFLKGKEDKGRKIYPVDKFNFEI